MTYIFDYPEWNLSQDDNIIAIELVIQNWRKVKTYSANHVITNLKVGSTTTFSGWIIIVTGIDPCEARSMEFNINANCFRYSITIWLHLILNGNKWIIGQEMLRHTQPAATCLSL